MSEDREIARAQLIDKLMTEVQSEQLSFSSVWNLASLILELISIRSMTQIHEIPRLELMLLDRDAALDGRRMERASVIEYFKRCVVTTIERFADDQIEETCLYHILTANLLIWSGSQYKKFVAAQSADQPV